MELDEAVRTFLCTKPDSGDPRAPIAQRRRLIHAGTDAMFAMFGRPVAPAHRERDVEIAVPGGRIRARVYRPSDEADLPIHVFLHGGGFWLGSIDEDVNQATCRSRCAGVGCVVVAGRRSGLLQLLPRRRARLARTHRHLAFRPHLAGRPPAVSARNAFPVARREHPDTRIPLAGGDSLTAGRSAILEA